MATSSNFSRSAAAAVVVAAAFGLAANSNKAEAVELKCKPAQEIMAAMSSEGQVPAGAFYWDGSSRGATAPEYKKVLVTVNPETREGYTVSLGHDGLFCPVSRLSNIVFYKYASRAIDTSVFMKTDVASAKGGINSILYSRAQIGGQFPVMKADEDLPSYRSKHVLYITANPDTGEGAVAVAKYDGLYNDLFSKQIFQTNPNAPSEKDRSFLTAVGEKMAIVPGSRQVASASEGLIPR
ncbi:MAG: hypothetical protein KDJ26_02445 [Alphaproteobacteria bacterium]|nr:hypothetical protein [Alphaproteobacteria bacterium]MCB9984253.1 hypothetical protein [Micavibrio sp.]